MLGGVSQKQRDSCAGGFWREALGSRGIDRKGNKANKTKKQTNKKPKTLNLTPKMSHLETGRSPLLQPHLYVLSNGCFPERGHSSPNLWVMTALRVMYQISCTTDITL